MVEHQEVVVRGSTMPDVGDHNERVVFHAIRRHPEGVTQVEVGRASGLSRQAVSLIVRRLIARGLVAPAGTRSNGPGKPATVLHVAPQALGAAGVLLDPTGIGVVVVDLLGRVTGRQRIPAPTDDPRADVARIARALAEIEGGADVAAEAVVGIGVASPGGIDSATGVVVDPPWLPGWRGVPVVELLEEATSQSVTLDKDTTAALIGELWAAPGTTDEVVLYLYVGVGVGSSMSVGGHVQRGATIQAGEIGHLPTGLDGPLCGCGRRGCLGVMTDVRGLAEKARSGGVLVGDSGDAAELHDLTVIATRAEHGSALARELISVHARALGEVLRTLIGIHDPSRVVIGGPAWPALAGIGLPIVQERAGTERPDVPIASGTAGQFAGAVGAAALVLDDELTPRSAMRR